MVESHRGRSLWASFRAGVRDLKDYPALVTITAVTVFMGAAVTPLGSLVTGLAEVGDTYVTMNSELIVLVDIDQVGEDLDSLMADLSDVDGVAVVRESTPDDLAALPPGQLLRYQSGVTLTIEPTGAVPVESVHHQVSFVAGVESAAPGVGVHSRLAIDLVKVMTPWVAVLFFAAGLLLVANLAYMTARTRGAEAEAMRLLGAGSSNIWVRIGLVVAIPTVPVILVATGLVAVASPLVADAMLPEGTTMTGARGPVAKTGFLLAAAAAVLGSITSLGAVWRVATK